MAQKRNQTSNRILVNVRRIAILVVKNVTQEVKIVVRSTILKARINMVVKTRLDSSAFRTPDSQLRVFFK